MIKTVQVLGATGSIGLNTLSIVREHLDKFKIKTLIANDSYEELAKLALEFKPEYVAISNEKHYKALSEKLFGSNIKVVAGRKEVLAIAEEPYDITISGICGVPGLEPTLAALKNSKVMGLANKESIVCAGELVLSTAAKHGCKLIPVDSEHSALYQALEPKTKDKVRKMVITASGGPFRLYSLEEMENVTPAQAVKHPNWKMGSKISVDSATLLNKGLEVIETAILFDIDVSKISVVIHPESIIHGMVNYEDGSSIAHLSIPNMRSPISYAMFYPQRLNIEHTELDLASLGSLNFSNPDYEKFPLLKLAIEAAKGSGEEKIILNVANEVAVKLFLNSQIKFLEISELVHKAMENINAVKTNTIDEVMNFIEEVETKTYQLAGIEKF